MTAYRIRSRHTEQLGWGTLLTARDGTPLTARDGSHNVEIEWDDTPGTFCLMPAHTVDIVYVHIATPEFVPAYDPTWFVDHDPVEHDGWVCTVPLDWAYPDASECEQPALRVSHPDIDRDHGGDSWHGLCEDHLTLIQQGPLPLP